MKFVRIVGFSLMVLGAVLILGWMIEPFRAVWPWLMTLPTPIRLGVLVSALGLTVLMVSLISERLRERAADKDLLDDI